MNIAPFGYKAARFIARPPEEDARVNILTGSIRSAKSWAANAKLLKILSRGFWPGGIGLITGNTQKSAKSNVVSYLTDWSGPHRSHYSSGYGELKLFGRTFAVLGAADEQAYKKIKGATVGLWIADEATLYPESFWDMATSRLSLPLSRCYATTNPADPYHYLKAKWLDNESKRINGEVWSETFMLEDNPNIEEEFKRSLYRQYTGVFHQRNILGKWVVAEGAVYGDVIGPDNWYTDSTRPPALLSQRGHIDHFASIDVGTFNALCMLDVYDDGRVLWVDNEFYWDSKAKNEQTGRMNWQKTNAEYAQDYMDMFCTKDSSYWPQAIIDPSAASFKVELTRRGIVVLNAKNEVLEGIRKTSAMLARRALRINEQRCPNLKREILTYAWDEKKAVGSGLEQPIKKNDHACFVKNTQIRTVQGSVPIQDLKVGDFVCTPLGRSRVTAISTREAETFNWLGTGVTSDHPVASLGWDRVDELKIGNPIYRWDDRYQSDRVVKFDSSVKGRQVIKEIAYESKANVSDLLGENQGINTVYVMKTKHGCYFANDILVSNCDSLRYAIATKMPDYRL